MKIRFRQILAGIVAVGGVVHAPPLLAQAPATLVGKVTDKASKQPLASVQVRISGTTRGTLTDAQGNYRLLLQEDGQVVLRFQRIGYAPASQSATVRRGETTTLNAELESASAVSLDQVLITGTGEAIRKRETGASTSRLDSTVFTPAAVQNFSQAIASRAPGVIVQSAGGTSGTSSRLRLRSGGASLSLDNQPLLVIDGILMNNSSSNFAVGVGGQQVSRLDDLNPDEIESIEVIKGPAATNLYGTGAANGVLQVTTKRGKAGKPRWTAFFDQGVLANRAEYPSNFRQVGRTSTGTRAGACSRESQSLGQAGIAGQCVTADTLYSTNPFRNANPIRSGLSNGYGLNVSGGTADVTYFLGAELERERGIFDNNNLRRTNLRANVTANLTPTLNAAVTIGYTQSALALPTNDNLFAGILSAGLLGVAFDCRPDNWTTIAECQARGDSLSRGYVTSNVPVQQYYNQTQQQDVGRLILGSTVNWTPNSWLKGVGRFGADLINRYDQSLVPPNKVFLSATTREGSRFQARVFNPSYTVQGSLSASNQITSSIRSTTTVGGQYLDEASRFTSASGAVLLPGTSSLNGSSARFAVGEANSQVVTLGVYAEERLELNDRLFVTASIRGDNQSLFGKPTDFVYYPAAQVSWVASEEKFFPRIPGLDQLRFRTAYGQSGQRPGFRNATNTLTPQAVNTITSSSSEPAVVWGITGNAGIKPEITSELEGGFEASLFKERLTFDVTGYSRSTRDLLVSRNLAPSLGVSASQFVNLSRMSTVGIEALAKVRAIDTRNLRLEQTINFTTFRQELEDLGRGIAPIVFGTQQHRAGYAPGGYFQRRIVSYNDFNGDGNISRINCPTYGGVANPQVVGGPRCEIVLSDSVEFLGTAIPNLEASSLTSISIGSSLQITALFTYRGGAKLYNNTREFRNNGGFANGRDFWDRTAPLADQVKSTARAMGSSDGYIEDASFVRFTELAATWTAPRTWARRLKSEGVSVTASGRNLALWSNYSGFDPEVISSPGVFGTFDFLSNPPARRFSVRVNVNY